MDTPPPAPPSPTPPAIDEATLKSAMNAFKKRLKLTILDQESKLGAHKPMTGGHKAAGIGIQPPMQFSRAVWAELAKQGKIKDMGGGFYGAV
jgi:hypothetical protein